MAKEKAPIPGREGHRLAIAPWVSPVLLYKTCPWVQLKYSIWEQGCWLPHEVACPPDGLRGTDSGLGDVPGNDCSFTLYSGHGKVQTGHRKTVSASQH